jgi:hypothetical protein
VVLVVVVVNVVLLYYFSIVTQYDLLSPYSLLMRNSAATIKSTDCRILVFMLCYIALSYSCCYTGIMKLQLLEAYLH